MAGWAMGIALSRAGRVETWGRGDKVRKGGVRARRCLWDWGAGAKERGDAGVGFEVFDDVRVAGSPAGGGEVDTEAADGQGRAGRVAEENAAVGEPVGLAGDGDGAPAGGVVGELELGVILGGAEPEAPAPRPPRRGVVQGRALDEGDVAVSAVVVAVADVDVAPVRGEGPAAAAG